MKTEHLQTILYGWLSDVCDRYLDLVDEMGALDHRKKSSRSYRVLLAKNALLEKWVRAYSKDPEGLRIYLDPMITDTCNRYLNLADKLGVIDRKVREKKSSEILKARNVMLDEWVPRYTKQLVEMLRETAGGEKDFDHETKTRQ